MEVVYLSWRDLIGKKMINTDKNWHFKENPKYKPELYNFTKGYKIMFYYRS